MAGVNSDLPQMVGTEGGGHGDFSGFPEGVVLHGGDQVDSHLGDAVRGTLRQQTKEQYRNHLQQHKQGLPADVELLFYGDLG